MEEGKIVERKILLKRAFPRFRLFEIGRMLAIPYFEHLESAWDMDEEQAAYEIASFISDVQLKEIFKSQKPRDWVVFRGRHYTLENGVLSLSGSWDALRAGLRQIIEKYGRNGVEVLKAFLQLGGSGGLMDVVSRVKRPVNAESIIADLEKLKILAVSYRGDNYTEWRLLDEVFPLIQEELEAPVEKRPSKGRKEETMPAAEAAASGEEVDYVELERQEIGKMDNEFNEYLRDLLKSRLESTIRFGKAFSAAALADYLMKLFGSILYFDSFLSIIQQYGLADVDIVHEGGRTGMHTGWNLALFGEPGTGKSFSTRDMILGKPDAKIYPHGIPGRNRYAGGMTPARFIRIGQAYVGRAFNFIIPEFNDWFRYKGMVEPLKLAMERGIIKYELHREVIGPYRFSGFFSVNYNVATFGRGYEVTISDPNFSLPYDEYVLVFGPDGYEFRMIGELVESHPVGVKVVSFNPETLQMELFEITGYLKHPISRIYEVRLRNGRRVKVTLGHSLFTISKDGLIKSVPTGELKPGDYVAIPRHLPANPRPLSKLNVAWLLFKNNLHEGIFVRDLSVREVISRNSNPSLRDFSRRIQRSYATVRHWNNNSIMPLSIYAQLTDVRGIPDTAVLYSAKMDRAFPAFMDVDGDFAWILGFYVAGGEVLHGRYVRLAVKKPEHAKKIVRFAEKLGVAVSYDGRFMVMHSAVLARLFMALGAGACRCEKRVPPAVFNFSKDCMKAFLDGYLSAGGCRSLRGERDSAALGRHLSSDKMYLQCFLGRNSEYNVAFFGRCKFFDAVPAVAVKELLYVLRRRFNLSQRAFVKLLGNTVSRSFIVGLETGRYRTVKRSTLLRLIEALPSDLRFTEEVSRLRMLVSGDLAWDEVVEVVDTGIEEPTYDIEVRPEGRAIENFVGGYGGIILHNSAIEDRMLCRLHRLTKERFIEIAQSQRRLAFGEIDTEQGARRIRDHVTLVYAIETGHPFVRNRFPKKPVMITPKAYDLIERAREAILECIPREHVTFSARLEDRAIRFACAASLLNYFGSDLDYIPVSDDALKYAVQLYVEEASVRSKQEFLPEEVLRKLKLV